MAVIKHHETGRTDWCHCCGSRTDQSADVWFPNAAVAGGAEHASRDRHQAGYGSPPHLTHYVRICADCARAILDAATGATPERVVRLPTRVRRRARA